MPWEKSERKTTNKKKWKNTTPASFNIPTDQFSLASLHIVHSINRCILKHIYRIQGKQCVGTNTIIMEIIQRKTE